MIGNMAVRITADRPNFPLGTLFVRAGSAANIALVGVPVRPGVNVTALALRVENVDGATADYAARAIGGVWVVDVPAAHFATVGSVTGGVSVWATGTGADGETSRTWCVGVGDLEVLTADADAPAPAPGQTFWPLRMFDAAPTTPTKYNAYIDGAALKIWNGVAWITISGGSGTVDDTVTRTSANPVKSSGIWGAIWGALTALPTGFTAIYDWVVARLAGKLDKSGGELSGDLFATAANADSAFVAQSSTDSDAVGMGVGPDALYPMTKVDGSWTLIEDAQLWFDRSTGKWHVPGLADAADLRYRVAAAEYSASVGTAGGYILADRTVNLIMATDETSIDIELPELANVGRMRDFYVRLTVSATSVAAWTIWQGESWDAMGSPPSSFAAGTYLYHISEVAAGVWHCEDMFGVLNRIPMYQMVPVTPSNGTLTVSPYTVATYTAGDSAAAFTVAVGTGETGKARDCELVIDCTATGAVAPTVTWPATFHPRTDAATDFACEAGKRNVYFISEFAPGEFAVGGWQETAGGNA